MFCLVNTLFVNDGHDVVSLDLPGRSTADAANQVVSQFEFEGVTDAFFRLRAHMGYPNDCA